MYTKEFKKKVVAEINLVEFVKAVCHADMHKAGDNVWQSRCPHPDHKDSTPSFTVTYKPAEKDWTWYCYGCQGRGHTKEYWGSDVFSLIRWLSDYEGSPHVKTFQEAVKEACEFAGIPLEQDKYAKRYLDMRLQAIKNHFRLSGEVAAYLRSRGLDMADIEKWLIGETTYIERHGDKRHEVRRITFPLLQKYGKVAGYSSRKLPTDSREYVPKYINSSNSDWFSKGKYLYGMHKLDDSCKEVYITEGVMDVILGDKYGKNFVAPLGTSFTDEHAALVKQSGKIPVFCQDADAAGQKAVAKSVAKMARLGVYAKVLILPQGMDMAELALREKENLGDYIRTHSILYSQYIMKDVIAECNSRIQEVLYEMLPRIREAAEGVQSQEERDIINGFVEGRFGVKIAV